MAYAVAAPDAPERPAPRARVSPRALAWAAGAGVLLLALWLRLPHIDMIPRFTDETDEIVFALEMARGERFPLANILTYIGPGFIYILAAAFAAFGPDPVLARYVVMVMGLLTVLATLALGRELALLAFGAGRRGEAVAVGLVAAGLLAVSPVHIIVSSRIAYAHSMTSLVTTVGLWLLVRAARLESGRWLALAGLALGFAAQSHPTVVALAPGAAAWALWRMPRLLLSRRLALFVLAGALGAAPFILHNVLTGFGSVREGAAKGAAYARQRGETPEPYPVALELELRGLVRTLAAAVGDRRDAEVPLTDPSVRAWAVLAPLALIVAARLGIWLPLAIVPPFLLILPAFNAKFDPLFDGRYFMPIAPFILVAVGALVVGAWRLVGRLGAARWPGRTALVWAGRGALAATVALVLAHAVGALRVYEAAALAEGGNRPYYELADRIARELRPGERALLDADLGGARMSSARDGVGVTEYLLTVRPDPIPHASVRVDEATALLADDSDGYLLVLLPAARQKLETRYRLTLVGRAPAPAAHRLNDVRLYRVREVRRPGTPAAETPSR